MSQTNPNGANPIREMPIFIFMEYLIMGTTITFNAYNFLADISSLICKHRVSRVVNPVLGNLPETDSYYFSLAQRKAEEKGFDVAFHDVDWDPTSLFTFYPELLLDYVRGYKAGVLHKRRKTEWTYEPVAQVKFCFKVTFPCGCFEPDYSTSELNHEFCPTCYDEVEHEIVYEL